VTKDFTVPKMRRVQTGAKTQVCFEFPDHETAQAFWASARDHELSSDAPAGYGAEYRVVLRKPKRPRSTGRRSQNTHFNGHVQDICTQLGTDFEDTKLYLKRYALSMGYPFMRDEAGEIVYSLTDNEPLPAHERDASSEEAAILIEAAHMFAAEHLITLVEDV